MTISNIKNYINSSKYKDIIIFTIVNYILYISVTILTLFLVPIIDFIQYIYHPTGNDHSFWVLPLVSLIPILFALRTIKYLFKFEIIKFIILIPMCYAMIDMFLMIYGFKELTDAYKQIIYFIF